VALMLGLPILVFCVSAYTITKQRQAQVGRNTSAPVTYVNYYLEFGDRVSDMEAEHVWVTVPALNETNANAVFASNQFYFEKGVGGYMGTQVWRTGVSDAQWGFLLGGDATYKVIFSIWDAKPSHKAQPGKDVVSLQNCGRFDGEGTGAHCLIPYPLRPMQRVGVKMHREGRGEDLGKPGDLWVGTAFDPITQQEQLLGKIFVPDLDGAHGYGLLEPWNSRTAFQEYYRASGCDKQALSVVGIYGPWFNGRKLLPMAAEPAYKKGCEHSDVSGCIPGDGCGKPRVLLTGGGVIKRTTINGLNVWKAANLDPKH